MKTVKWEIWYKWMWPTSLFAGGIVPIIFCSCMVGSTPTLDRLTNGDTGLFAIIFGGAVGLLIGGLQLAVIPRKLSFTPSNSWWWWWLLISAIIWSISSYIGILVISEVSEKFFATEGGIIFVIAAFIIFWPIAILGIGLAIQGVVMALLIQYVTLNSSP